MKRICGVRPSQLVLLLAVGMASAHFLDPSHNLANERTSIERTYELTKYLEHQLKEIKDTYLTYLGPPFNEKDFSPPRPNSTALSLPSAATRLELWRGLENRARLAQNQRAYSILLGAVRELARSTLCPYLQTSLLHFCTGLDGLLGSISGLMTTLGYALPPPSASAVGNGSGELQYLRKEAGGDGGRSRPAPLMSQSLYKARDGTRSESGHRHRAGQRRGGARVVRGEREDNNKRETTGKKRGKEGRRAEVTRGGSRNGGSREKGKGERGKRGRRGEPESWEWAFSDEERVGEEEEEDELEREGGTERWGRRRRLLSITEEEPGQPGPLIQVSHMGSGSTSSPYQQSPQTNSNSNNNNHNDDQYSYNLNYHLQLQDTDATEERISGEKGYAAQDPGSTLTASSPSLASIHLQRRPPRSLFSPTLHPPLSTLSLFYQFGTGEEHTLLPQPVPLSLRRGPALLTPPLSPLLSSLSSSPSSSSSSALLSVRPALNDFSRKVEGFWVLRELQSWLWRSAKDFNRLKRRLRG